MIVHTVLARVSHVPLTQPHQVHRVVFILTINSITISIRMTIIIKSLSFPTYIAVGSGQYIASVYQVAPAVPPMVKFLKIFSKYSEYSLGIFCKYII